MEIVDALIEGLRRGDAAAFDQAYSLYRTRIYSFLHRLAGRRDLAEDLFQETWLKLARSAMGLREDTELGAWLYTVARNAYRSHRRWTIVDAGRLRGFEHEPTPERSGPDDDLAARRELSTLERALAQIPENYREILLLVGVEGFEQERVAEMLGVSYDVVRQRLSRGRALLADRMAGEKHDAA